MDEDKEKFITATEFKYYKENVELKLCQMKAKLDNCVTRVEWSPGDRVVKGLITLIVVAVATAIIYSVVKKG